NLGAATYLLAVSATANRLAPELSWANPAAIAYGAALTSNQLDATASVGGTFVYSPASGAVLNSGTNLLSVLFAPANTVSYTSATEAVSLAVLPALLTVAANNATRVYGQNNPAFTGGMTGLVNGDNITATYGCGASASSPVGMYAITPTLVDPGDRQTNYTVSL